MSADDADDDGPLVRRLREAGPLRVDVRMTGETQLGHDASPLFGRRGVHKPAVALRTIQRLGNARHALAQRTVAGVMEVHAPFAPKPKDDDKKKDDGKGGRKGGRTR